jgi:hypothetical protein
LVPEEESRELRTGARQDHGPGPIEVVFGLVVHDGEGDIYVLH